MHRSERSGFTVAQPTGCRAFIPAPLPPAPPLDPSRFMGELSLADQAVGRLDGATRLLPDHDLFLAMYVRNEALLSSQIEGTQCTLDDVLAFELDGATADVPTVDVQEVVNYIAALGYGLERLATLPICGRLLREVHARLLRGGRGAERNPGEFRSTQNWIGPPGCTLAQATYVPPPPEEMRRAISDLDRFVHGPDSAGRQLPPLVVCGLVHAQFETVHPFLDGNGRIGRLLITLLLCERGVLSAPVLYLSTFLRRHRPEYFDHLTAVRSNGAWEAWLVFFLRGIEETAGDAASTAQRIHTMREADRHLIDAAGGTVNDLVLHDRLFSQPLVNAKWVAKELGVTPATANAVLARLTAAGVLREITGQARNRVFRYDAYLALFDRPAVELGFDRQDGAPVVEH